MTDPELPGVMPAAWSSGPRRSPPAGPPSSTATSGGPTRGCCCRRPQGPGRAGPAARRRRRPVEQFRLPELEGRYGRIRTVQQGTDGALYVTPTTARRDPLLRVTPPWLDRCRRSRSRCRCRRAARRGRRARSARRRRAARPSSRRRSASATDAEDAHRRVAQVLAGQPGQRERVGRVLAGARRGRRSRAASTWSVSAIRRPPKPSRTTHEAPVRRRTPAARRARAGSTTRRRWPGP